MLNERNLVVQATKLRYMVNLMHQFGILVLAIHPVALNTIINN